MTVKAVKAHFSHFKNIIINFLWPTKQYLHLQLDATLPYHYTTKAEYLTLAKSLQLNGFSKERPPANTIYR